MKQQCHISFVYGSWVILLIGLIFYIIRGNYFQAGFWVFSVPFLLWLYVRYFPSLSTIMGYGSVADQPATNPQTVHTTLSLYTGMGCPFCPLVKKRLVELQSTMGFTLNEIDVTFKPDVLIAKSIRALPVIEVGKAHWIGNATSEQLATFIRINAVSTSAV